MLHDEIGDAVVFVDVMERADVRMRELRDDPRLPIEALAELRVGGERVGQHFDRNGAIETRVARLVDLAHPAGAERPQDLVRSESGAWRQHRVSWKLEIISRSTW
jgi:hypothetical protein